MKTPLIAAAISAGMLFAAAGAEAAPNHFTRFATYTLACKIDSYSVEKGKVFILVTNTAPRAIPQGAQINLRINLRAGFRVHQITRVDTAYTQVTPGTGTITLAQPARATACFASVTLRRY
jgi:hypothetical protein